MPSPQPGSQAWEPGSLPLELRSDVDFLVEMESGRSLLDLGGLLMDLQDLLDCRVDIVTQEGLRSRICDRVLAEAVDL
ncbi:hypothetical protein PN498_02050 [Oscillatoria sp. CS-180]|uniref:nucleotidyltransferase domain-containing protein n=1 Tax=Oscillatoria sp. CS-180 TaxID=3021720 RepID=UPI00232DDA51|nr:nucleotidyltransferase domain-containing protein [Oscillatoria sp. CS-180]MDB9524756.1 hypothetical protein [Oscillatoria sp. CS-180]